VIFPCLTRRLKRKKYLFRTTNDNKANIQDKENKRTSNGLPQNEYEDSALRPLTQHEAQETSAGLPLLVGWFDNARDTNYNKYIVKK
jgi:hypothetical protein